MSSSAGPTEGQVNVQDMVWDGEAAAHILVLARLKAAWGLEQFVEFIKENFPGRKLELSITSRIRHLILQSPADMSARHTGPDGTIYSFQDIILECIRSAIGLTVPPDNHPVPFPDVTQITVLSSPEYWRSTTTSYGLYYRSEPLSSGALGHAATLSCFWGNLDSSRESEAIRNACMPRARCSFHWHIDNQTLQRHVYDVILNLPLPQHLQHLIISFEPIIGRSPRQMDEHGYSYDPDVARRIEWLSEICRHLQRRRTTPMLVEVKGGYSVWNNHDCIQPVGAEWDGLLRKVEVDVQSTPEHQLYDPNTLCRMADQTWPQLGANMTKAGLIRRISDESNNVEQVLQSFTVPYHLLGTDDPRCRQDLGTVLMTFCNGKPWDACDKCHLLYGSTTPFARHAVLPHDQMVPPRQGGLLVHLFV